MLSLAPLCFAQEVDPSMPVITELSQNVRVKAGDFYTLRVQAHIPNGDEVGYDWDGNGGAVHIRIKPILPMAQLHIMLQYITLHTRITA